LATDLEMKRQARKEGQNRVTKRLQQLTETLAHRQQPAQPTQATPPQEIPDPDKAPLGTLKFLMNQQREVKIAQGASVQEQQRFQLTQRVMDEASRLEMDFQREQPDYGTATNSSPKYNEARAFVINIRRAELTAIGTYNRFRFPRWPSRKHSDLPASAPGQPQSGPSCHGRCKSARFPSALARIDPGLLTKSDPPAC
jgi:hypothetical protein